jgi:hypothetical protein
VLIMMVLTAPRLYLRWYQPAIQAAAPLFGVGTVLMAVEATPANAGCSRKSPRRCRRPAP